ncbi:MAG TPA: glucose 1-dehydrogenase [Gammaproteobacteria bacterium]|nr:glucose 1-dehydrogenase [Gammaproteobacteria bacterium]
MSGRVKNKVALITGAASGIGAATAKLLAEEGAHVIITDINESLGNRVTAEITSKGHHARFLPLDVANECMWQDAFSFINENYKKLDILVNNAGILIQGSITDLSLKDWRHLMAINLDGVFLGTKHAIPLMQKSGGGSIVNLSSAAGIQGSPTAAAYCASKGAVRLFTKATALECAKARNNIRVNSVHPGPVFTSIFEKTTNWSAFVKEVGSEEKIWETLAAPVPLGRVANPIEISYAILYLASDESSYATGTELIIDGGQSA